MTDSPPGAFPPGHSHDAASWDAIWREALGPAWRTQLALFGVLLFVAGAWLPLADPDLGMHLATGEWIARARAFPTREIFAWTRAGEPFQAYSWLPELTYFLLLDRFGPLALHALHGLAVMAVAASTVVMARAFGWSGWGTIATTITTLIVAVDIAKFLRPQLLLFVAMPLAWALVKRAREAERIGPYLVGLVALGAFIVNSHLLFPLTAAPCILLLTHPPADRKRIVLVPAAIVAGWLMTPNLFDMVGIFQLNFAPNAAIGPPSGISEYRPGFEVLVTEDFSSLMLAVGLLLLPFMIAPRMTVRERALHGLLWLVALLLFAIAVRAVAVWWLVMLPGVGLLLSLFPSPTVPVVRLAQRLVTWAIVFLLALQSLIDWRDPWLASGDARTRTLPSLTGRETEPLVRWLDCHTTGRRPARLLTVHNYGSYLVWRTPWLSESIDGRTIFPDSVNAEENYLKLPARRLPLMAWKPGQVAILPEIYNVASVLDTASGWRKVARTATLDGRVRMVGLWVREDWWAANATGPLPERPVNTWHRLPVTQPDCERPPIRREVRGPLSFDALVGQGGE
jgi:hypothetical protein